MSNEADLKKRKQELEKYYEDREDRKHWAAEDDWYEDAKRKYNQQNIVLMSKFSPVPYAQEIMKDSKFIYDNRKILWRYNSEEGLWVDDAELFIKSLLRKKLLGQEQQKKNYCEEIIEYIKGLVWTDKDLRNQPRNLIAFKNVLYNLDTDEFIDFSPEYFLINKIPINLDSEHTDFGMIDFFLEEIVGNEKKETLYELMAYCMLRDYLYQKFFILYGGGSNGKSAFLKLLIKFLGEDNISSKKPQTLINDKFSSSHLFGKLANISPDIPYTELSDSSLIRELTGDDPIDAQEKYKQGFKFYNYAKMIFSANELPQVKDRTYAFNRRIYIVIFDKTISKARQDPEIINRITTDAQMSGLGWYLLKVIKRLKENRYKFTYDPDEKEMSELYEELSSSLSKFIKEECVKERGQKIADFELKERFFDWCAAKGLRMWRVGEVNKYMAEKFNQTRMDYEFFNKETGKFSTKFVRAWEGLGWKKSSTGNQGQGSNA